MYFLYFQCVTHETNGHTDGIWGHKELQSYKLFLNNQIITIIFWASQSGFRTEGRAAAGPNDTSVQSDLRYKGWAQKKRSAHLLYGTLGGISASYLNLTDSEREKSKPPPPESGKTTSWLFSHRVGGLPMPFHGTGYG